MCCSEQGFSVSFSVSVSFTFSVSFWSPSPSPSPQFFVLSLTIDVQVLVVSHNQDFMTGLCNELWIVKDGTVTVQKPTSSAETQEEVDEEISEGFGEMLGAYRESIVRKIRAK